MRDVRNEKKNQESPRPELGRFPISTFFGVVLDSSTETPPLGPYIKTPSTELSLSYQVDLNTGFKVPEGRHKIAPQFIAGKKGSQNLSVP
jgi:hypothetical protein